MILLYLSLIITFLFVVIFSFVKLIKPASGFNEKISVPASLIRLDDEILKIVLVSFNTKTRLNLVKYFCEGIYAFRNSTFTSVFYPGVSGTRGAIVEGLEGFARTSTMLACWIKKNENVLHLSNDRNIDLKEHLLIGLHNGTDKTQSSYWGDFNHYDQRVVESADIAITVFLLSDQIKIDTSTKNQIANWLKQINEVSIYGGNWYLFKIVVNLVLSILDAGNKTTYLKLANESWAIFKTYHLGSGWFSDGEQGKVDYYNVWQMQYMLYWIRTIDGEFDNKFICKCICEFSKDYKYFISDEGVPMFGRSSSYRYAASVPFLCKALTTKKREDLILAHSANKKIWQFYTAKVGLKMAR